MVNYPVKLIVDYPKKLDKLSTFFRIILVIPILIIFRLVFMGFLSLPTLLMILFRQKYPRWWFDWNVAVLKFSNRVHVYLALLRDEYPSTDQEQAVHLKIIYPNVKRDLNRWLPLVKWFLAIPHYFVIFVLSIAEIIAIIISWFAILFTGKYPKDLFEFVVGILRWYNRILSYAILLVTDRYPPFTLSN